MCTLACHACLEVTEHRVGHKDSTQVIAKQQAPLPSEPSPALLCLLSNGENQYMKLACLPTGVLAIFFFLTLESNGSSIEMASPSSPSIAGFCMASSILFIQSSSNNF